MICAAAATSSAPYFHGTPTRRAQKPVWLSTLLGCFGKSVRT